VGAVRGDIASRTHDGSKVSNVFSRCNARA
jgi:hypothetical protein